MRSRSLSRTGGEPAVDAGPHVGELGRRGQARASLALALAAAQPTAGAQPLALELLRATAPKADAFEDRWRLVSAARLLPPDPEVDAWLVALAKDEERWMLRAAAIEGLAEHKAAQTEAIATSALRDAYPRVRMAAATALGPHRGAQTAARDQRAARQVADGPRRRARRDRDAAGRGAGAAQSRGRRLA